MLTADRVLRSGLLRSQQFFDGEDHRREPQPVLPHAVQQLNQVGDARRRRQLLALRRGALHLQHIAVSRQTGLARLQRLDGEAAQILNQRDFQHDRPGPELADRQRCHPLIGVDEDRELLQIQPAVAVAQELDGHRVDARVADPFAGREGRELPVVGPRKVLADLFDFGGHEVKVVQ
jgi:hypothetical protein